MCPINTIFYNYDKTCKKCSDETYSLEGTSLECSTCNYYDECKKCPAGKYSTDDMNDCIQCQAGYKSNEDNSGCDKCPTGLYSSYTNSYCYDCHDGIHKEDGSCTPCPNRYISVDNTCKACRHGMHAIDGRFCGYCDDDEYFRISDKSCASCYEYPCEDEDQEDDYIIFRNEFLYIIYSYLNIDFVLLMI